MQNSFEISKEIESKLSKIIITCASQAINSHQISAKEWFSLTEGAKYVGVSHNTFVKFRHMGLKVCEIEGIKRVSRKEIDRFLEKNSF